jgi:hypothetical protein
MDFVPGTHRIRVRSFTAVVRLLGYVLFFELLLFLLIVTSPSAIHIVLNIKSTD